MIVIGVIIVGVAWFGIAQWNNLKALYLAMTSNTETLQKKQNEQDKKREELLQQYGLTSPDSNQVEEDGSKEGQNEPSSTTEENSSSSEGSAESSQEGNHSSTPTEENGQAVDSTQAQLQKYIDQLYQVEARYQSSLNGIVESTKSEFWSLPKEQQSKDKKLEIVRSKMDGLIAQEKACDAEVENILSNIRDLLKQSGQSTELVDGIRSYYEDSKANWKAAKMTELYK